MLCTTIAAAAFMSFAPADLPASQPPATFVAQKAKRKIDKTCLMICEKWGPNDCEKWVMKCRGDPGYPNIQAQ